MKGDFKSRRVKSRTYAYKFAVKKHTHNESVEHYRHVLNIDPDLAPSNKVKSIAKCLPIQDEPFITEICSLFDVERAQKFVEMIRGTHNFGAFATETAWHQKLMSKETGHRIGIDMTPEYFDRSLDEVVLNKLDPPLDPSIVPVYDMFDFYCLKMTSHSFFRSQVYIKRSFSWSKTKTLCVYPKVRRIMTVLFAVASRQFGLGQVQNMLENPGRRSWPSNLGLADPNGLYLANIEYSDEDLIGATDELEKLPVLPHPDFEANNYKFINYENYEPVYKALKALNKARYGRRCKPLHEYSERLENSDSETSSDSDDTK